MRYKYTNLTDNSFTDLVLSLSTDHSNGTNTRIKDLPAPLYNLMSQYHSDNLSDDYPFHEKLSYDTYIRDNKLSHVFPQLINLNYTLKPTHEYLEHLKLSYATSFTQSDFDKTYPIAVRYTNGTNIWLVERPPFPAKITYRPYGSGYNYQNDPSSKTYDIWMPWTVMLINMDPKQSYYDAFLFFNDGPINSLDEHAIPCFFPNMYGDGRMCLNQTSIMLQQHLANLNTFDINTIYNFLINDYMSGGWNLDLGIQNFDRLRFHSETCKNANAIITRGIPGNKSYPSSLSGRYQRVSHKKYINNFLNYFSLAFPYEILSIISEAKQASLNAAASSAYVNYRTYSELIQDVSASSRSTPDSLSINSFNSSYINHSFDMFVNPNLSLNSASVSDLKIAVETILNFLTSKFEHQIQNVTSKDDLTSFNFYSSLQAENPFLYMENLNSICEINSSELSDSQFFLDMILSDKVLV